MRLRSWRHMQGIARMGRLTAVIVCLAAWMASGCNRAHYRQRADQEVYQLVGCAASDPRWAIPDFNIDPDPRSRFFDPDAPDCPPMPPDDPASHRLIHCVDGKQGWPYEEHYGCTQHVENPDWKSFLPFDESGTVILDGRTAMELALLHSRDYQQELEDLYLSALEVTFQRFRFDAQFFGGNSTSFAVGGPLSGQASDSSSLATRTPIGFNKLFATGSQLAVEVANSVVWEFSGSDGYTAVTPLSLTFIQPLLRRAGRAVVLEQLTNSERALLANVRQLERFRRGFYLQIIAGLSAGAGPSPGGIGIGAVSPGVTGGLGNYLSLLTQQLEITNQRSNVTALRDSLERIDAFYDAGRISRTQVDEILQTLYDSQVELLSRMNNYENQLDTFKITLGLPPELPVRIEDRLLDPFNLLDPGISRSQDAVNDLLGPVRETLAALQDAQLATQTAAMADQAVQEARAAAARGDQTAASLAAARAAESAAQAARVTGSAAAIQAARAARSTADKAAMAPPNQVAEAVQGAIASAEQASRLADSAAEEFRVHTLPRAQEMFRHVVAQLPGVCQTADSHLPAVEGDLKRMLDALPTRHEHIQRLAQREEFRSEDVDPRIVDINALHRSVVELHAGFYGKEDPVVRELLDRFFPDEQQRRWFEQMEDIASLKSDLANVLAEVQQLAEAATSLPGDSAEDLQAWADLYTSLRAPLEKLSSQLLSLSLLQARARLEIPTLTPVEIDPEEALRIARTHRRDWMNARAALVDRWRQIELAANELRSDLSVVFQGDLTTRSDTLGRRHNTTGNLSVGLEFDAPLTRLAERNAYREVLISYQRARREYYAFEDNVSRVLRDNVRAIRLAQLQFELQRAGVRTAIARVEQQQLELLRPPRPGQEEFALGPTTARDLVTALRSLLGAQNSFLRNWVQYEILRMGLDFNMGTMELDDAGMWIDPGPIERGRALPGTSPEALPPELELPPLPEQPLGTSPTASSGNTGEQVLADILGSASGHPPRSTATRGPQTPLRKPPENVSPVTQIIWSSGQLRESVGAIDPERPVVRPASHAEVRKPTLR